MLAKIWKIFVGNSPLTAFRHFKRSKILQGRCGVIKVNGEIKTKSVEIGKY
ncbi:MAG: hypothetical protein ACTSXD_14055 [Candidatus Heimdallarchaeaceae archaeon]